MHSGPFSTILWHDQSIIVEQLTLAMEIFRFRQSFFNEGTEMFCESSISTFPKNKTFSACVPPLSGFLSLDNKLCTYVVLGLFFSFLSSAPFWLSNNRKWLATSFHNINVGLLELNPGPFSDLNRIFLLEFYTRLSLLEDHFRTFQTTFNLFLPWFQRF